MHGMRYAIIILLLVSACTAVEPQAPATPAPADDTCNASDYAGLVGQDATALERVLLMGKVRVIRPGQAVTMDFMPDRINFRIAEDGRIAAITCG